MPRDLTKCETNTLTVRDPLSGEEVQFIHRTPETIDRVRYQSNCYKRDGNRMIINTRQAAIDAAYAVLTGIRDGDFVLDGKTISSDPESPHYHDKWKRSVRDMAGDLLMVMGTVLFADRPTAEDLQELITLEVVNGAEDAPTESDIIPPLGNGSGA